MTPCISVIPLFQLASGDRLSLQLYRFVGATPGKKAYIQANLHGAEIAGNAVIHHLIQRLASLDAAALKGEIWLVPTCNPLATNQRSHFFATGRFNPYDGRDWNRIFWDYEQAIAADELENFARSHFDASADLIVQQYRQRIQTRFAQLADDLCAPQGVPLSDIYRYRLQTLAIDADYLIDLHTSGSQGLDYLYYFRDRQNSASAFLLDAGILLDQYDGDAFDEAFIKPWLALEQKFGQMGRSLRVDIEAWTLELGSAMTMQPESIAKGVRGVRNYLASKGMLTLTDPIAAEAPPMWLSQRSWIQKYYAPAGGMVIDRAPLGSLVEAGQPIYQLLTFNRESEFPTVSEVKSARSGLVYDLANNDAVNEGEYVIGVLPR